MNSYLNQHHNSKQQRKFRIKIYFGSALAFLAFIGLFWIIAYSPVFRIRAFNIEGKEHLQDSEIIKILEPLVFTNKIKNFLGINNLLSWNIAGPDISKTALISANISRNWLSQTVSIIVKERGRLAIWCDKNNSCSWIDDRGMAFENAPQTEGSLIATVYDAQKEQILNGMPVAEPRFMENIIKILLGVKDLNPAVKKITYDRHLEEIIVDAYSGPDLFFSVRFDPAMNISSLKSLEEKNSLNKAAYIDLRVENKIYYKL